MFGDSCLCRNRILGRPNNSGTGGSEHDNSSKVEVKVEVPRKDPKVEVTVVVAHKQLQKVNGRRVTDSATKDATKAIPANATTNVTQTPRLRVASL